MVSAGLSYVTREAVVKEVKVVLLCVMMVGGTGLHSDKQPPARLIAQLQQMLCCAQAARHTWWYSHLAGRSRHSSQASHTRQAAGSSDSMLQSAVEQPGLETRLHSNLTSSCCTRPGGGAAACRVELKLMVGEVWQLCFHNVSSYWLQELPAVVVLCRFITVQVCYPQC